MMTVRNLVSWAGEDFSVRPGELIELSEEIALGRIEAGLAERLPAEQYPLTEALVSGLPADSPLLEQAGEIPQKRRRR
jgi:hypothetical protein